MKALLILLLCSISIVSQAFIPPASMILERTCDNAGNGIYQIEQEVEFPSSTESLFLKETWLVENENSMKLVVSSNKDGRDYLLLSCHYQSGQRNCPGSSKKLSEDFIERYFHFRRIENFANTLIQLKLMPAQALEKKKILNIKTYTYRTEDFLRLSRVGGVVNYAFGEPSPEGESGSLSPGLWIEQDQFIIRKFRTPSNAEVFADKYSNYSKGLAFPKERQVQWDNKQIILKTLSVSSKSKDSMATFGTRVTLSPEIVKAHPSWPLAEEFYSRFR